MRVHAAKFASFLILGALANIAVAVALACTVDMEVAEVVGAQEVAFPNLDGSTVWFVVDQRAFGTTRVTAWIDSPANLELPDFAPPGWCQIPEVIEQYNVQARRPRSGHEAPTELTDYLWEDARGWPFRALKYRHVCTSTGSNWYGTAVTNETTESGWKLEPFASVFSGNTNPRVLPKRAIWLGFFANTVSYAFLICSPFVVRIALRRHFRRRRGRCKTCAYDLRGANHLQCPECGVRLASGEDS